MPNVFIFADEAGCFAFNRQPNVSRYFILCTVAMESCDVASDLLSLRRKLAWEAADLGEYFHATTDKQHVRDAVYSTIIKHHFSVQATIMEKSKAREHIKSTKPTFYKYAYFYHFKHGVSRQLNNMSEALVTTASLGSRKERAAFENAVGDVMRQTQRVKEWKADFRPAHADPCLQVADYCAWAVQRKWERQDLRAYNIIRDRVSYEYDLWAHGNQHFY